MPGSPIASRRAPSLDLDRSRSSRGVITITAKPAIAAIQGIDLAALRAQRSRDRVEIVVRAGPRLAGAARPRSRGRGGRRPGAIRGHARRARGARRCGSRQRSRERDSDAEAEGSAEPWAQEAKANLILKVRSADFGPLLDLKPADTLAQNIGLSSRVQLTGNKLTFDDLDSTLARLAAARPRGGDARRREGRSRVKSAPTQLALAPAFALALGAAGHDAAEPLGTGLAKGWRGRIAFQALRGAAAGRQRSCSR